MTCHPVYLGNRISSCHYTLPHAGDLISAPSCLELVLTDYPQLTILNTSNSTLSSYMCMDGMIPDMRMESVCTRNGTWEPDPKKHNCTPEDIKSGGWHEGRGGGGVHLVR